MTIVDRLRPLLREPLVYFLLAGALLFLLIGRGGDNEPADRNIIVGDAEIARISANWERTWQRPPTRAELDRLIDDFVREEILYREALRLGLDEDDTVIRRRLRSKMEFLARAEVESVSPDDATLQEWLDDNAARYAEGARTSFEQVYIGAGGDDGEELAQLRAGADSASVGEPLSVPRSLERASRTDIARQFGEQFAASLDPLEVGGWQGPVPSGFGRHLVRITAREPGEPARLSEIRQRVENDWRTATLDDRQEDAYRALRESYTVEIAGEE
ncbi:MAG: peptidyl-prolyl cis-trans isomerase [Sphingomonadaceae bacterium]|nr:peptidyl-prolyl cis-trans isomerase [Sphingomonadaceae bacterium]